MLLNPLSTRDVFEAEDAEVVARNWWIFLLSGIISLVFGLLILSIDWSLNGLAAFIGTLFILQGGAYLLTPPLDGGTRSTNVVLGLLGIAVGIILLAWPDKGLYTLGVFIGAWVVASGLLHIIGAFVNRHAPHWWLVLVLGLIEVPIGMWGGRGPGWGRAGRARAAGGGGVGRGIGNCVT